MGGGGGDAVDLGYWEQAIGRSFHRERVKMYGVWRLWMPFGVIGT